MGQRGASGFVMRELVALIAMAVVIASVLGVLGTKARQTAMAADDLAKLRQIGVLTGMYAADNKDVYWGFSWKAGQSLSQYPDLNNATTDIQAGANQAVDILRRRAGRTDIPAIFGWIPHILYSHLALEDYASALPADRLFVSSGDVDRLKWASDPLGFDQGKFLPCQPAPSAVQKRWPYSSSWQMPAAFFTKEWSGGNALTNSGTFSLYQTPAGLGIVQQATSIVAFPSQKVLLHDFGTRHLGRPGLYANPEARVATLISDGSAVVLATQNSNPGWNPPTPTSPSPLLLQYTPSCWDPPLMGAQSNMFAWYRYTREGLFGRDFGGPEVKLQ